MKSNNFRKIIKLIYTKSALQKKKLQKYLSGQDDYFFYLAEEFTTKYSDYLKSENIPVEDAVDAYLKMCNDMIKSQIYFMRTGKYSIEKAEQAFELVYNKDEEMKSYMIGLAISQFLWESHYKIYQFFLNNINIEKDNIKSYLEIGPGHGLFLKDANQILRNSVEFTAIDISKTSIDITRSIMNFLVKENKIKYITMDILDYNTNKRFDFITMGEVLEHVNSPEKLLFKFNELLSDKGHGFISTCVDCPTIDHVYHFESVEDIREMLSSSNLIIEDERVLPVEDLPMEEIVRRKITINYCAIVRRHKK